MQKHDARSAARAKLGRRDFLRWSAAGAALLPFLPRLEVEAVAAGSPCKRLVVFETPNGTILRNWRLEGLTSGATLPAQLSEILQPLAAHRERMIVVDGVDNRPACLAMSGDVSMGGKGHTSAGSVWTQWAPVPGGGGICDGGGACSFPQGPSFDQLIAEAIGDDSPHRSLTLGVVSRGEPNALQNRSFYDIAGQPLNPENDPGQTYDLLFAGLNLDPSEKERLKRERGSVIDYVKGDLSRLSPKLSGTDRQRVEAHLEGIRALEKAIQFSGPLCEPPGEPEPVNVFDDTQIPLMTDLQLDMAAAALACDLTRVIGFQWGREGSWGRAGWLGQTEGSHTLSHWEGDSVEQSIQAMTDLNRWFAEKLAAFVDKLSTLGALDDTLIVWTSSMCEGASHWARNIPVVIVQGESGPLETNRYLRYGNCPSILPSTFQDFGGESMSRLIVSLCHAMGETSVDTFGDPAFGTGPLPGL